MISIIVPIYNVEQYLPKCLDSILAQTNKDIEVILIDDGSTDNSGKIGNRYAKKDARIRVFHTENGGLSAARNLGLDKASGEYIGFVDADDWLDREMYEVLLNTAEALGADIVECGFVQEFMSKRVEKPAINRMVSAKEAVEALVGGEIQTQVWNKLWKRSLFDTVRFPDGRNYEDIATAYKVFGKAKVTGVKPCLYHQLQRKGGISQTYSAKNLVDYWLAHKQRYDDLLGKVNQKTDEQLLLHCAYAVTRTWMWDRKREIAPECIRQMSSFVRENIPVWGKRGWPISLRGCIFLTRYPNRLSFFMAHVANRVYRLMEARYYR